jgi:hypothetical protein
MRHARAPVLETAHCERGARPWRIGRSAGPGPKSCARLPTPPNKSTGVRARHHFAGDCAAGLLPRKLQPCDSVAPCPAAHQQYVTFADIRSVRVVTPQLDDAELKLLTFSCNLLYTFLSSTGQDLIVLFR